jgi:hypothetical protein
MAAPYLNRDESIILTTHNVNFNSLVVELILTNQRLIIFDSRHPQIRYQTIPLTTIETVMSREDAQGNPEMYLSISPLTSDGAPISKEFIFLRQSGGERKQECDAWLQQLKEQIALVRQQKLRDAEPAPFEDTDIIFDEPKAIEPEPSLKYSEPLVTGPDMPPEPAESPEVHPLTITGVDTGSTLVVPDLAPVTKESVEQAPWDGADEKPKEPLSSRFHPPPAPSGKPKVITITAIILVILAIAGGVIIYSMISGEKPVEPSEPVITQTITVVVTTIPTPAVTQTPSPTTTIVPTPQPTALIPEKGVWVKVSYEGNYTGRIGASGDLRQVNTTGVQFYQLAITEGIVEATIQKQDGSGRALTIEVYQNGRMVARDSKASPGATVDLRIEVKKA